MAATSAAGAKRQRMIPRGQEEEWHWVTYGGNMVETPTGYTTYMQDFDLPGAGIKQDGKMSMYECSKIWFYVEPWAINGALVPLNLYCRFTLQANAAHTVFHAHGGKDYMNLHQLLERPSVYLVHTESHAQVETRVLGPQTRPCMYDMTAPDGRGILFKGNKIWTSYLYNDDQLIWLDTFPSYAFRCLIRRVWVDPAYYVQSAMEAANMGDSV